MIPFSLNGEAVEADCRADRTVLEWLRADALLRGTKEGCAEGDCGACSILMRPPGDDRFRPANSCILLMGQVAGAELMTIEGLAVHGDDGHTLQQVMAQNGASQCGFCTPGIVCALAALSDGEAAPEEADVHEALAGNLCRCTGYRPIVEAALGVAPVKLKPTAPAITTDMEAGTSGSIMLHPRSLEQLYDAMENHREAPLLAGGTDENLAVAQARKRHDRVISLSRVAEITSVEEADGALRIGGAARWCDILPHLERHWPSFATMARRYGSVQVRSVATMGGNLATSSPIGDSAPSLIALGATLRLASRDGLREMPVEDFITGYRENVLGEHEVIAAIDIPLPRANEQFRVYKVSKRYDQDISTVCGAFALTVKDGRIEAARIAFGGMGPTPMRCDKAEAMLDGTVLDVLASSHFADAVAADLSPMSDLRGTSDYRMRVARNLPRRLAADLAGETVEVMAL